MDSRAKLAAGADVSEWGEDCLEFWARILIGPRAHWCRDFDDLPVDDSVIEALYCHCYDGTPEERTPNERCAIEARRQMSEDQNIMELW